MTRHHHYTQRKNKITKKQTNKQKTLTKTDGAIPTENRGTSAFRYRERGFILSQNNVISDRLFLLLHEFYIRPVQKIKHADASVWVTL